MVWLAGKNTRCCPSSLVVFNTSQGFEIRLVRTLLIYGSEKKRVGVN